MTLLFILIFLMGFGLVMLYSTSAYGSAIKYGSTFRFMRMQFVGIGVGTVAGIFLITTGYKWTERFAMPLLAVAAVLCIVVNFTDKSTNGSSRWLYIGSVSFQPSEIGKVAIIVFVAHFIAKYTRALSEDWHNMIKCVGICLIIIGPVALNNLSTAVIIAGIAVIMLFVAVPYIKPFGYLFAAALVAGIGLIIAEPYRLQRILNWNSADSGDSTSEFQTLQGLYAIGSGGFGGKGLGESIQKTIVPEANNDMIFSIICEELGLVGGLFVILLFVLLIWRLFVNARAAKDTYGSFLLIGIMVHISLQVILNIAVVTATIPNTGVTLPFFSYGGTSAAIMTAEMFLALSVTKGVNVEEDAN